MDSSLLDLPPLPDAQDILNQQIAAAQQNIRDNYFAAQNAQNAQMNALNQGLQQGQNPVWLPPVQMSKSNKHERAIDLLKMRMGGVLKEFHPDPNEEFLICHVYKDTVFVFFVAKGVAGNLEESVNIFPSDKLIAQLRLLWL